MAKWKSKRGKLLNGYTHASTGAIHSGTGAARCCGHPPKEGPWIYRAQNKIKRWMKKKYANILDIQQPSGVLPPLRYQSRGMDAAGAL